MQDEFCENFPVTTADQGLWVTSLWISAHQLNPQLTELQTLLALW